MLVCQFSVSSYLQFLRRRILNIFFENLPFMSPRQPIKLSDLDKSCMQHGGLLNKLICEKKHKYLRSDFFHLFGNSTHTGSIGKNCVVFPPIGKNSAFKLI